MPLNDGQSKYFSDEKVQAIVAAGKHRQFIGGRWEELGQLQLDFLKSQGLLPRHRVLDVGCGALRAGVFLARYLEPAGFYGIDLRQELLDAGFEREVVPAGLQDRLPRANLAASGDFDATGFGQVFDFAIAQSVFTHIPLTELTRALNALHPVMKPGGQFFVTLFERPADTPRDGGYLHADGGITTYPDRDPFDLPFEQLVTLVPTGWEYRIIGDWGHPRDQQMITFQRVEAG